MNPFILFYLLNRGGRGGYGSPDPGAMLAFLLLLVLTIGGVIGGFAWYDSKYPRELVKSETLTVEIVKVSAYKHSSVELKDKATGQVFHCGVGMWLKNNPDKTGKVFTTERQTWMRKGKDETWYEWPNLRKRVDDVK